MFASGFSWFHLIPGLTDDGLFAGLRQGALGGEYHELGTTLFIHACLVSAILIALAFVARSKLTAAMQRDGLEKYFPDENVSVLGIFELYVVGAYGLIKDIIGDTDARYYFWLPGGVFLYIFGCNILGIFPGFLPPTDSANNNVMMAVFAWLVTAGIGFFRDPKNFIQHMMGPVLPIAFLLFPVELISLCVRPVSLMLRLTGNMFGDHQVFTIMSDLVPVFWPVPFLILACFVSFMQAFVFSILSVVYISLGVPHHDDHH